MLTKADRKRILNRSKNSERRIARFFDTVRTPLSGINSRHTNSDTLHDFFHIENKYAEKSNSLLNLYNKYNSKAKINKKPLILTNDYMSINGFLITIHSKSFELVCKKFLELKGFRITEK